MQFILHRMLDKTIIANLFGINLVTVLNYKSMLSTFQSLEAILFDRLGGGGETRDTIELILSKIR